MTAVDLRLGGFGVAVVFVCLWLSFVSWVHGGPFWWWLAFGHLVAGGGLIGVMIFGATRRWVGYATTSFLGLGVGCLLGWVATIWPVN